MCLKCNVFNGSLQLFIKRNKNKGLKKQGKFIDQIKEALVKSHIYFVIRLYTCLE